jgi:DnaJ family protein A protein 5
MPHCSRALYESFFSANFSASLARQPRRVLVGNDLADYMPDLARPTAFSEGNPEVFTKARKKRKGHVEERRELKDGVLRRIGTTCLVNLFRPLISSVPYMKTLPLSLLPETHLPGFARAFLALAFQWIEEDNASSIDWDTPLPPIQWPDNGEVA